MGHIISSVDIDSQYEWRLSRKRRTLPEQANLFEKTLATNSKQPKPRYLTLGRATAPVPASQRRLNIGDPQIPLTRQKYEGEEPD
jgi:hypothetical protein